jgi:hypothetical protein
MILQQVLTRILYVILITLKFKNCLNTSRHILFVNGLWKAGLFENCINLRQHLSGLILKIHIPGIGIP